MFPLLFLQIAFGESKPEQTGPATCEYAGDCDESSNNTNTMLLCSEKNTCEPVRIAAKKSKDNRYLTLKMLTTACPKKDVLFKCTLQNDKVVEICDIGYIRYTYGAKDAPEITLAVPREDVGFHCWTGISDRGSSMNIPYGDTSYTVGQYWNMNDPQNEDAPMPPPFLNVQRNTQTLATHQCKEGGNFSFEELTEPSCMSN